MRCLYGFMVLALLEAAGVRPFVACSAQARELHVAVTGDDTAPGTAARPWRTINHAAQLAQPGDVVTIHGGTYREWVQPARGGAGEDRRIVYRAAPGERAVVKGSERITAWEDEGNGVWRVRLPNSFFGDYNPYALKVSGGWLNYGQWHHRGDVYLNEEAFREKQSLDEVRRSPRSWFCQTDERTTTLWANFGDADPNRERAEINVRESLFMPVVSGLGYITVDGLEFRHAAANWAPPVIELQTGAVGPRMGKRWIIQNCTVVNARCVGIILGQAPGVDYTDIDAYGDHLVRHNLIRRCGQAGIAGQKGATRSLIAGNLIEETNYRAEFGGWETAAIKFHNSVDTVISNNLIRVVRRQQQGAFGIWMDFGNQGTRITGNIISGTQAEAIFLEMDHGPMLIDNNVVLGGGIKANSENLVFAHNLFVNCPYRDQPDTQRRSQYFAPHTTRVVGRAPGVPANQKWYNNLFLHRGLGAVKAAPGYEADHNVYWDGARPASFGDEHSVVTPFAAWLLQRDQPRGVVIEFTADDAPFRVQPARVAAARFGKFAPVNQALEDREGRPLAVDTDRNGRAFKPLLPGPLANLKAGRNRLSWRLAGAVSAEAGDR